MQIVCLSYLYATQRSTFTDRHNTSSEDDNNCEPCQNCFANIATKLQ